MNIGLSEVIYQIRRNKKALGSLPTVYKALKPMSLKRNEKEPRAKTQN